MGFNDEYQKLRKKRLEGQNTDNDDKAPTMLYQNKTLPKEDVAPIVTANGNEDEDEGKKWHQGFVQKGDAFEDGYQFGDVAKTVLGTVTDVGTNLVAGVVGWGENLVDAGAAAIGTVYEKMGKTEKAEKVREFATRDLYNEQAVAKTILHSNVGSFVTPLAPVFTPISLVYTMEEWLNPEKEVDNGFDGTMLVKDDNSVLGDVSDSLVQSAGETVTKLAINTLSGGLPIGDVITGVTVFGEQAEQALREDATFMEAGGSALISAAAEILFERLSGGIKFGGRTLDEGLTRLVSQNISNVALRNLTHLGLDVAGEGFEEVATEFVSNLGTKLYKEEDLGEILFSEEALNEYIQSAIGGGLMGGGFNVGGAVSGTKHGVDYKTGLNNDESRVVEKLVDERIKEQTEDGKKLSGKEKEKIREQVMKDIERGRISVDDIERILGGASYETYKGMADSEAAKQAEVENKIKELENLPNEKITYKQAEQLKALRQELQDLKDSAAAPAWHDRLSESVMWRASGTRLAESYRERARRGQAFEADLSRYDAKQAEIVKKAAQSGILNNTGRTHEFVDMIAKISADKGVLFDFTNNAKLKESGFAVEGATVNGYFDKKSNTVGVNIDSAKALDTVVGHEITHVIEGTELYSELQKAVFEYAKTKGDFDSRRQSLAKLYAEEDIDSEMTADLIGEYLFTDEDFVKNLSVTNRNVFQKIYDEIKYLYKVVTAGSKEARELERVKRAFDKAYKESGKASGDVKHSLSDSDGKQLSKGQQEYFKDSKMRDENGNLMVMYHGSQDAGFHVFDPGMSDDDTSLFFVDRNDVAASYSGTTETYEAQSIRTAEDMNKFIESIGVEGYEVIEHDGKFDLIYEDDLIASRDTAKEIYEEFCWYEGVGEGDANYKVYLNLKNPLVVDANGRPWNKIDAEFSQEIYDKYQSLTAEEKDALTDLAEWEDFSLFNSEIQEATEGALASAYAKMGEDCNIYDLFSVAADNFSEESMRENARGYLKTRDYAKRAKEQGYDGVIFKNIVDNGGYSNGSEGASTVAIAFDSNQIKSVANENPTGDADIRYSMSGVNALTANHSMLLRAEHMLDAGADSETVRQETGWYKGYDGKMRFEIDDSKSELIENPDLEKHDDDGTYFTGKLSDILKHDDLYEAYPQLRNVNIVIQPTDIGTMGVYQPNSNYITLSIELFKRHTKEYSELLSGRSEEIKRIEQTPEYKEYTKWYDDETLAEQMGAEQWLVEEEKARNKFYSSELGKRYYQLKWGKDPIDKYEFGWSKQAKETLMHEIQHAVQKIEGFARGSSPEYWTRHLEAGLTIKTKEQREMQNEAERKFFGLLDKDPTFFVEMNALLNNAPDMPRGKVDWDTLEQIEEDPIEWQEFDKKRDALEEKYGTLEVYDFIDLYHEVKRLQKESMTADDAYYHTAGEIEARDTANRLNLNAEQRRSKRPDIDSKRVVFADPQLRYSLTEYTAEEKKAHNDAVLGHFGRTFKWSETGYLLLNGERLDLSGKHDGAPGGYRTVDHRDITDALGYDYGGGEYSGSLIQFMSEGNIRIVPEIGGINLSVKPTKAQEQALSDFISRNRGEVVLDIDDLKGNTVVSVEYPRGTFYKKVLDDIREWFDNGKQPEVSGLSSFRSLSTKGEAPTKGRFYGKDMRLEVAPVAEDVSTTTEQAAPEAVAPVENVTPVNDWMPDIAPDTFAPVSEKAPPAVLYNKRGGENGWDAAYSTAQEALNDAVQNTSPELWAAFNEEIDNNSGSTPITNALIAVQEDVRQETITPMQGAQLLNDAYNEGGVDALKRLFNPYTGNLFPKHLERAKQYETIAPVSESVTYAPTLYDLRDERDALREQMLAVKDDIEAVAPLAERYGEVMQQIQQLEADENARLASLDDADVPPEVEAPYVAEREPITIDDQSLDKITGEVGDMLGLDAESRERMAHTIQKYAQSGDLTESDLFDEILNNYEYYEEMQIENDEADAARRFIKGTKLYLHESLKGDFNGKRKDGFNAFRREHFGHFTITTQKGAGAMSVDSLYSELSDNFPDLFPADIGNSADMLQRMADVASMKPRTEYRTGQFDPDTVGEAVELIRSGVARYAQDEKFKAFNKEGDRLIRMYGKTLAPVVDAPTIETANTSEVMGQQTMFEEPAKKDRFEQMLEREMAELEKEFAQRRSEMETQLADKNAYIGGRAMELYYEISNLKKGVRASKELGYLLDHGFEWRDIKSKLLTVKSNPGNVIYPDSATESVIREMLSREYEDKVYELSELGNEYQKRVTEIEQSVERARKEAEKAEQLIRRAELHKGIIDRIRSSFAAKGFDFDKVLKYARNLSTFATVDNTPQRVMEKALGYKQGQILADETVNKVAQNETEGIRWLNSYTDRKSGLLAQISKQYHIKPGSKESAAAQMYAEGFFVSEQGDAIFYGDAELARDFPDARTQENIKGLAADPRIRKIYDETLAMINESRVRNGYPEIPKLDNYFLHFRAMDDTFSRLGLPFNPNDIKAKDLPTDLNGVTADLKPGQPYFASAMHRRGVRTTHDLLGGLERYLTSAKNQIYHIDDIQTLRALRNYIADTYGQANGLDSLDVLSEEETQERIKQVYGAHLSTFAKFLNEEANVLAGKTALIDRGLEGIIGRRGMTFIDNLNKQVGSNMVGYNISSSLTNFLPVVQAFAKTNKTAFVKGFAQTVSNRVSSIAGGGDNFAQNSPVMVRRQGADRFHRTAWQKLSDPGYALMGAVDSISTEIIARAKYNELMQKGLTSAQAHTVADKWVSRLMGDRSLGQMPQLYNSKMLGLVTKFQLEVRNQLDSQFYDTIQEAKVSNEHIENQLERNAKTAAKVASTFFQLAVAQHIFGAVFESIAGYNPAFDIIEVIMTALGWDDEEDSEDTVLDNVEQGFLALLEDLPYTSTLTGGRIPISNALPIEQLIKGKDEYGNDKPRWKTALEALPYYVSPGGYGQAKKTAQGLSMFSDKLPVTGSYTDSGNLRFPVEETPGNIAQAAIFGQWANENARYYFDNDIAPLNPKQTQEYADVGMSIRDYWKYRKGLSGLKTLEEKAEYIDGLDLTDEQKNILINNIADREEDIDMSDYDQYGSFGEFDFAAKNPEKYEFFKANGISYEDYDNADEDGKRAYTWAYENPEKYTVAKSISDDFLTYYKYKGELNDITADKDENGESIRGSAKDKKIDYINNLDLDYGQRIILFKSLYKADDTYNADIVDYLNEREDISYEDMVTILTELGFTVKNGNVYWE